MVSGKKPHPLNNCISDLPLKSDDAEATRIQDPPKPILEPQTARQRQ